MKCLQNNYFNKAEAYRSDCHPESTSGVETNAQIAKIQTKLKGQEIIHTNSPLYTLKIRAEHHEVSPYFSPNYKGLVLAIILFATI